MGQDPSAVTFAGDGRGGYRQRCTIQDALSSSARTIRVSRLAEESAEDQ